jgi:hypothetical protein
MPRGSARQIAHVKTRLAQVSDRVGGERQPTLI